MVTTSSRQKTEAKEADQLGQKPFAMLWIESVDRPSRRGVKRMINTSFDNDEGG